MAAPVPRSPRVLVPVLLLFALAAPQTVAPAEAQRAPAVGVTWEHETGRLTWRVENPSRYDTPALVPHAFRQHYVTDTWWLLAHADVGIGPTRIRTAAGFTPATVRYGDDIDTFTQPDGDVVTSGTIGEVRRRAWRLEQRVTGGAPGRRQIYLRYGFQRDHARFLDGLKVVTHTRPTARASAVVTTRETTVSDRYEVGVGLMGTGTAGGWWLRWNLEGTPYVLGRLLVQLPDKYPGAGLRFAALAGTAGGRATLARSVGPLQAGLTIEYRETLAYRASASLRARTVRGGLTLGWSR